jgi:predicted RNase H-like nuclease (RuvC/YqgF family)
MDRNDQSRVRECDDFDKLQVRRAEALHFRFQREIKIRDDEIARLETDLALVRGRADIISGTIRPSDKRLESHLGVLRNQAFEARSQCDVRRSKIQSEQEAALRELDANHEAAVERQRRKLRSVLFDANRPALIDDVEVFLNLLRGPRPSPSEIRTQKRWESLRNEVTRFEEANALSKVQIQNLKEEIEKLREKVKELHDFEPFDEVANSPPVPDLSAEIACVIRATSQR